MNDRIKMLAIQAGFLVEPDGEIYPPVREDSDMSSWLEEFAALITKQVADDCAELVSDFVNERTFYYAGNVIRDYFQIND